MAMNLGGGGSIKSDINVTPLVDVMLVLLIIFMVTAPLIQQGVEVNLPEARAKAVEADEQKLVLSIKSDKSLYLGSSKDAARIPFDLLEDRLQPRAGTNDLFEPAFIRLTIATAASVEWSEHMTSVGRLRFCRVNRSTLLARYRRAPRRRTVLSGTRRRRPAAPASACGRRREP